MACAIGFSQSAYSISETSSVATITIIRTNGAFGAVSASYTTANGTALAGADFAAISEVLGGFLPKTPPAA